MTTGSPRYWPTELLGRVCLYPQNVQRGFHTIIPSEDQGNQRRAQGPPPLRRAKRELWMQVCSSGDHQGTAHRNHYSPNRAATQVSMKYRVKRNQCQDHILNPTSTAGQSDDEQGQTKPNKRTGSNETQTSPHALITPRTVRTATQSA